jgi:hypothetical protein
VAALGLVCDLRPAGGKLAQARVHGQEQHAAKSHRGSKSVFAVEGQRHASVEKDYGRPYFTDRSRGKTCLAQADFHPRWRGISNDRDVQDSSDAKTLSRVLPKHQNDNRLSRRPTPQASQLRPGTTNIKQDTIPDQRALSLQPCQQRGATLRKGSLPQVPSGQKSMCLATGM